jgi:hypothetical protein
LYGPTETTLAKCSHEIVEGPKVGIQPIGRPLPGVQVLPCDDQLDPCPVGEEGELVIRTPYRTIGYLNAPDLQRRAFVRNPYGTDADDLLYRTGDLGRLNSREELEILGRVDDQVKINGVRVEPAEVTAELAKHRAVQECAVLGVGGGAQRLAAFVVPRPGADHLGDEVLRSFLSQRLPGEYLPAVFIRLGALPKTLNGKIDRRALLMLYDHRESGTSKSRPSTETELWLARVWGAVLGVASPSPEDDFFLSGGTSLIAAELSARISLELDRTLRPQDIYRLRTLGAIAGSLDHVASLFSEDIPTIPHSARYPLSPQQKRFASVYMPTGNRNWCNMSATIPLWGGVTAEEVGRSLRAVVVRQDSLATTFHFSEGELRQAVSDVPDIEMREIDLSGSDEEEVDARLEAFKARMAADLIDLETFPLFRAVLLRYDSFQSRLLFIVHHMVFDGFSLDTFQRDLSEAIRGLRVSARATLPALPTRYRDYAVWKETERRKRWSSLQSYWRRVVDPPPERLLLPLLAPEWTAAGASYALVLPTPLAVRARQLATELGTTPFVVMLTAFQLFIAEYIGRDDILINVPTTGRSEPSSMDIAGNFHNIVLIRRSEMWEAPLEAQVSAVHTQFTEAQIHQDYQTDEILRDLGIEIDPDRYPLTSVLMGLVDEQGSSLPRLKHDPTYRILQHDVRYDVFLTVRTFDDGTLLEFQHRRSVFDAELIERFAKQFVELLGRYLRLP